MEVEDWKGAAAGSPWKPVAEVPGWLQAADVAGWQHTCCAWMFASHVEGHKVGDGSWDECQYVAHSI